MSLFGPSFDTIKRAVTIALKEHSAWRNEPITVYRDIRGSYMRKLPPVVKFVFRGVKVGIVNPDDFPTESCTEKVVVVSEEEVHFVTNLKDFFDRNTGKYLYSDQSIVYESGHVVESSQKDKTVQDLTEEQLRYYRR